MSLLAWFPLINDTLDYSGNEHNGVANNLTDSNSGKFGDSYLFGDNSSVVSDVINHSGNITLSAWIYPTDLTTVMDSATIRGIVSNHNHIIFSNFTMFINNSKLSVEMGFTDDTRSYGIYSNTTILINKWYHVLFTYEYKTNNAKIYINGVLDKEVVLTKTVKFTPYNFIIGQWAYSYITHYEFLGKINDVRIYDNVLSEKEIKEIYQAKVLHYNFNYPVQPIYNIVNKKTYGIYNNFDTTKVPSTLTKLSETYQSCDIYRLSMTIADATVLSSFRTSLHSHGVYGFSQTFLASTKYCFSILFRPVTHTDIVVGGTASNIGGWTAFSQKYYKDDWMITGQYRDGSVATGRTDNIFTSFYTPSVVLNDTVTIDFCCPRLVEGIDYLTDYIDYQHEDFDIIEDGSGYGNSSLQLTQSNCPRWVTSGKTGGGCYLFDGINDYINVGSKISLNVKPELTISLWLYPKEYKNAVPICKESETFSLKWRASGNPWWRLEDIGGVQYDFTFNVIPSLNQWHHVAFTYDGVYGKCYVDGTLTYTRTVSINLATIGDTRIGAWSSTTELFNGMIDDVRIYATSLSSNEILDLYKVKASIDDKGVFYSSEFREKPNMIEVINEQVKKKVFSNGLSSYTQSNCHVTLTDDGYRIYRPPNLIYPDAGNTMWGGLKLNLFQIDNFYLFKNRKYKFSFKIKGQSSNSILRPSFTNQMGWSSGGGLTTLNAYEYNSLPSDFQGEMEIYACFNVNEDVFKYCTTAYSNFVTGETYNCYLDLGWGFTYTSTGVLGTDLYLSDFKFIDITDDILTSKVTEKSIVNTDEFSEIGPYEDLISWIPLDKHPDDISISGVNGAVYGSPSISSGVGDKNSYLFDGVDDYINTNLKCNTILNDNERFSLTAWIYLLTNPTAGVQLVSCSAHNSETEGGGFGIGLNSGGSIVFKLGDLDTSSEIYFTSTVFGKNVWHFVSLTFDGSNLNCYKNGVLLSQTPRTVWNSNNYNILIGKGTQGGWGGFFNGKISDVRIYSKSLSVEEINILYELTGGNENVKTKILKDKIYVKNEIKEV